MSTAGGAGGETSLFSVFRSLPPHPFSLSLFYPSFTLSGVARAASSVFRARIYFSAAISQSQSLVGRAKFPARASPPFSHVGHTSPSPSSSPWNGVRRRICLPVDRACFCVVVRAINRRAAGNLSFPAAMCQVRPFIPFFPAAPWLQNMRTRVTKSP